MIIRVIIVLGQVPLYMLRPTGVICTSSNETAFFLFSIFQPLIYATKGITSFGRVTGRQYPYFNDAVSAQGCFWKHLQSQFTSLLSKMTSPLLPPKKEVKRHSSCFVEPYSLLCVIFILA